MRKRTDGAHIASWSACGTVVLALLAVPVAHAATRINECNSEITISQLPMTALVGQTSRVTLTVSSTDARDNLDNAVAQIFDKAMYTGDCVQPPGLPCVADSPAQVMYQGNLGGSCPGVVANPMGDGVVEFDFVPDLSLLVTVAPGPVVTPASCTIEFDVTYSAPGTFAVQAMTGGICQNGPMNNSETTVTTAFAVRAPDLSVDKACTGSLDPATGQYPYTVTLENTGTEPLTNCVLTDPGATCAALSSTSLAAGATATANCTSSNSTNTVTATCDYDIGAGPQQIMRTSAPAVCPVPSLGVTNQCTGPADAMGQYPYRVTATNGGTATLTDCVLAVPGATCSALSLTTLAPGATAEATCTSPNFETTATVTCNYASGAVQHQISGTADAACEPVPTLGEYGLIALALLLALASWWILRRKDSLSPV